MMRQGRGRSAACLRHLLVSCIASNMEDGRRHATLTMKVTKLGNSDTAVEHRLAEHSTCAPR